MIELGNTYKDIITGFQGIATGTVQYISGCNQALIAPKTDQEARWFDEQRLILIKGKKIVLDNTAGNGFDASPPVR